MTGWQKMPKRRLTSSVSNQLSSDDTGVKKPAPLSAGVCFCATYPRQLAFRGSDASRAADAGQRRARAGVFWLTAKRRVLDMILLRTGLIGAALLMSASYGMAQSPDRGLSGAGPPGFSQRYDRGANEVPERNLPPAGRSVYVPPRGGLPPYPQSRRHTHSTRGSSRSGVHPN